jgi:hypothetical protein
MGELYPDSIDRALMPERENGCHHGGCYHAEAARATGDLLRERTFPVHIMRISALYDIKARPETLLSGTR